MINDFNVMALPSDTDTLCLSWEDENKNALQPDFDRGKSGGLWLLSAQQLNPP